MSFNNCAPGVRVEVSKFEDRERSCDDSTTTSSSHCDNSCDPVFTIQQIQVIKELNDEGVLQANNAVSIINNKVNAFIDQSAGYRETIARKLVCIDEKLCCTQNLECAQAQLDKFFRCELEKKDQLIAALTRKLAQLENQFGTQIFALSQNVDQLHNAYCGLKNFDECQQRFDNVLADVVSRLVVMESRQPICGSGEPRIAPLPLGSLNGAPNPLAGRPAYQPLPVGVGCGSSYAAAGLGAGYGGYGGLNQGGCGRR